VLVEVSDALGNREVVGIGDLVVVEQVEDEAEDLVLLGDCCKLRHVLIPTYLVPESALLHYVHADIENVLHQLLALGLSACRCLLACLLLLILAGAKNRASQNLQIPCLNRDTDDLLVVARLVAALEYPSYCCLQVLLDIPLQNHGRGMRSSDTGIAATWGCGIECARILAREQ